MDNRQLHIDEVKWIKEIASRFAALHGITVADAERRLAQQAYRQVQAGAGSEVDLEAFSFLKAARGMLSDPTCSSCGPGYMFYATPDQKAATEMYAGYLSQAANFYEKNGLVSPAAAAVLAAVKRDSEIRSYITTATKLSPAAAALVIGAGISPSLIGYVLSNPGKAVELGLITAETAAGIVSGAVVPSAVPAGVSDKIAKAIVGELKAAGGQSVRALAELAPVEATAKGFVNSTKVSGQSYSLIDLTTAEQDAVISIITKGDSQGQLTEGVVELMAQRQGLTSLSGGKYSGNKGFDHVFIDPQGGVTILMDSKQLTSGSIQLGTGAGGHVQLSDEWITAVLDELPIGSDAFKAVTKAMRDGTLVRGVAGVDRTTGTVVILPIKRF